MDVETLAKELDAAWMTFGGGKYDERFDDLCAETRNRWLAAARRALELLPPADDLRAACRYALQFLDEYDVDRKIHPSLRKKLVAALADTPNHGAEK